MQLTASQAELVRTSWSQIKPLDTAIAERFYTRLFEEEPSLKGMFHTSLNIQYRKLTDTLNFIVDNIENPSLETEVRALAIRHIAYGTKNWHYDAVGNALLHTLKQGLGEGWTIETSQAWEACYEKLSGIMIDSVNEAK